MELILCEGRTCWRRANASRVGVLVDAQAYYAALAAACERAESSIVMVGWDFNSRIALRRDGGDHATPSSLGAFLSAVASERPDLEIHVLGWDFAMIYALEREMLPLLRLGLQTHGRVHFRLDDRHPLGASQHQKIVVVDDRVAFSGGIDVTACRWDTPEHAADDPRREDPGFGRYGPFHDVQLAVEGDVAAHLGELVRDRWERAVGDRIEPPARAGDPWPPEIEPDFRDVGVAIARTFPAFEDREEVHEVEAQYVAAIAAARRSLYIENQYLSATRVVRAIADRLREPSGPEVVMVLPASSGGWLEEATMGVRRTQLLRELQAADLEGRLRVYWPRVPGVDAGSFTVHAKVLVVDDALLRVGSANLSNRSMGLDAECDLSLESEGRADVARRIRDVRDRLLAEHLDCTPSDVAERVEAEGSLAAAVDSLRGDGRSLVPLEVPDAQPSGVVDELLSEAEMLDPERPIALEVWLKGSSSLDPEEAPPSLLLRLAWVTLSIGALGLASRILAPGEPSGAESLQAARTALAAWPATLPVAMLLCAVAALVMVPVSVIAVLFGLLLSPAEAALSVVVGAFVSAPLGWWLGRSLWRDAVRVLAGRDLGRLARALARRGVWAAALMRSASRASFGAVNLVAGASRVRLVPFLLGSALVLVPGGVGVVAWTAVAWQLSAPPDGSPFVGVLAGASLLLCAALLRRWMRGDPGRSSRE